MERLKKLSGISPCVTCGRVKDPENCENKHCKLWKGWFLNRWELLRIGICRQLERLDAQQVEQCLHPRVPAGKEEAP